MIVRWLGAFGKSKSLHESLSWELSQSSVKELAAERLRGLESVIKHARVGLLVKSNAVIKSFSGDVYSVKNEDGTLKKKRSGKLGLKKSCVQRECWVKPEYIGIIIKGGSLNKKIMRTLKWFASVYRIDIFILSNEGLKKYY